MKKKKLSILNNRKFKYGGMSTLVTVLFVVAIMILNLIVAVAVERIPASVDLTSDNIYQLSDETIEYLETVDEAVDIIVCYPEDGLTGTTYGMQIVEIINNYAKYNDNISVRWTDLTTEPTLVSQYSDYSVTTYSIIVESEKRTKVVSLNDCLVSVTDSDTGETTYESEAEIVMSAALLYVTEDSVMSVAVLTGHSDTDISGLTTMLEDNNYEITEVNITTEELTSDYDMVAIYAPTTDYTSEEVAKLDAFLDNDSTFGKMVIYVASYAQPDLPMLESFLEDWGITVGDGTLAETTASNVYDNAGYIFSADISADETYAVELRDSSLPYLLPYAVPLTATWDYSGNRATLTYADVPDSAIIIPTTIPDDFTVDDAESGADCSGIIVGSRTQYDGTTPYVSYVVAFASDGIFASTYSTSSSLNNNEYSIAIINELAGKESDLDIAAVTFDAEALTVTQAQYQVITILFMIIIPVLTILLGIFVWIRRRNK